MSYDINATFSKEQVKIEGTSPIEMYVLNASLTGVDYLYYVNYNQDMYGWQLNNLGNLTATQQIYTALPIKVDYHTSNLSGETSNLKISIPNVDRYVEGLIQNYNYLRGRELYQITTFARNLPAGSNGSYLGVSGQDDHHANMKEKMYIDSTTSDDNTVTFVCKPKMVIKNVALPNRLYTRECQWNTYLGSECDPTSSIDSVTYPTCNRTIDDCASRNNLSRFGGFPSIPKRSITI